LFNEQPVELGMTGREAVLVADLQADSTYARLFQSAFPESDDHVSIDNVIKALASFVRSIIAADSAFDRLLYLDDQSALSESALRGMRLFFSEKLNCGACHQGQNFAGGQYVQGKLQEPTEFHNTGLYNVGGHNRYPEADPGLRSESRQSEDDGRFRAPSLRNIAVTAPYMHDGSISTLSGVIDHYAAGGRSIDNGQNAGIGSANLRKSERLTGFELSSVEKNDLLSFLNSLTDHSVLEEQRYSKPEDDR
jgi:cytochrome c peroxidase